MLDPLAHVASISKASVTALSNSTDLAWKVHRSKTIPERCGASLSLPLPLPSRLAVSIGIRPEDLFHRSAWLGGMSLVSRMNATRRGGIPLDPSGGGGIDEMDR